MKRFKFLLLGIFTLLSQLVFSQDVTSKINSGDTAWMLISTALVMFMTAPALALFYGGLVKRKNVLNILMQCFITLAVVSLLWVICGYTLSFSPKSLIPGFIGNFDFAFLKNVGLGASDTYATTIPHLLFVIYQGMFAVITPALIIGAFAERMKFSSFLIFVIVWCIFVYFPVAHWIWSTDGWLFKLGVVDFAGGIVVHINAGIASLVAAIMIGKRKYLKPTPPHNLTFTMFGAAMLWFGWFGFNAGSALGANGLAANAFVVTNTAAAAAVVIWFILDLFFVKKPTMLGSATGAIAGLAAITPAAGFVDVGASIVIGAASSLICYFMVVFVKNKIGYDDALDAFGVHGIGGIFGSIIVGVFASPLIQSAYSGLLFGNPKQLFIQVFGSVVVIVYSLVLTIIIFKVIDIFMGLRVSEKEEAMGLDITQHNERGYTVIE
ncbi:MAG: ammonia channel protein [Spirochaetes bacterium GWD1_27_9]|nr:MAG: ammonia channel protein [Spirochaetes bacterium GWB1_27_13]OHD37828.1 MAG: ammonia channel protein [Spirochaetes bacterium GWD1_27_9]